MTMTPPIAPPTMGATFASGVFIVVGVACTVIVDRLIGVDVVCTGVGVVWVVIMTTDDSTLVVWRIDDEGTTSEK